MNRRQPTNRTGAVLANLPTQGPAGPRLREISRLMKQAAPVFIVGEARSGSTILYRTLLKHPAFRPRVENLQESSFMIQAPHAWRFTADEPRNMRRFMLDDDGEWDRFLRSLAPVRRQLQLVSRLPGRGRGIRSWNTRVARSYAFHALRARGALRLLEKTPNHICHIDDLMAAFPRARLLYIHRHPLDVYSSLVRRGRVDPKADWARISPAQFCERYRDHLHRAQEGRRRYPGSLSLISYEDFTTSPEQALDDICRFLGVASRPEALGELADPGGWAHWEKSRHLYEGIKTHTKRWEDYCSPYEAEVIQDLLSADMTPLGYRRRLPAGGPSHAWDQLSPDGDTPFPASDRRVEGTARS